MNSNKNSSRRRQEGKKSTPLSRKPANKKPVKNVDLWKELYALTQKHQVEWEWVKGHSGHPVQEVADDIARKTAEIGKVDEEMMDEAVLEIGVLEI